MLNDLNLYEFVKDLSIAGWVVVLIVFVVAIYLMSSGVQALVTKKCYFCEQRIPKRLSVCQFCDRKLT